MNCFIQKKHLLADIRKGDFTHPEGKNAIEFVLSKIAISEKSKALDVGSGLGGTVAELNKYVDTIGVDKDSDATLYSTKTYSHLQFITGDVLNITSLTNESFDLFTIFSAFYAFTDQTQACEQLAKCAKPNADLLIFDYSSPGEFNQDPFYDDNGQFTPINLSQLDNVLGPWKVRNVYDITGMFRQSYASTVSTMIQNKALLIDKHGTLAYDKVLHSFNQLIVNFDSGKLGGCLIHACI